MVVGEISPGIFSVGTSGRDPRWTARKGGHPTKMARSGESERSSCSSEDEDTPDRHGRIPIAILGSNQRENYGPSVIAVGRATNQAGQSSLIDPFSVNRPVPNEPVNVSWTKYTYPMFDQADTNV